MFDIKLFIKENLARGFENGSFTREQVNIYALNYKANGYIDENCFNEILEEIGDFKEQEEGEEE